MLEFMQQLINGFSLGSIYAVLALGLAMVYSTLGILNFAYGELITIVGYTMYFATQAGAPFLLAAGLGITFAAIASLLMQLALFRPLRGASFVTLLFASLPCLRLCKVFSDRRFPPALAELPYRKSSAPLSQLGTFELVF